MPGKFADFVVLAEDPMLCEPNALQDIAIKQTWVGGRLVYDDAQDEQN